MNNENNKNNNLLMYIIIFLLIVLIGIGAVLVYRSYSINNDSNITADNNNQENNNNVNEDNKIEENQNHNVNQNNIFKEISLEAQLVKELIQIVSSFDDESFTFTYSTGSYVDEKFGILYKQDKLLIKDLPADVRMNYVIKNLDLEVDTQYDGNTKYHISKDKFKKIYLELLGEDVKFEMVGDYYQCPTVFVENDDIIIGYGCGGTRGPGYLIKHKYINAEKNTEELNLYVRVALIEEIESDGLQFNINIYGDLEHKNLIASNIENNETQIFSYKYLEKYPLYKYTFKYNDNYDGIDDYKDYYFYSVEKVK